MTERAELEFVFPDDDAERLALTMRIWSPPEVPALRHRPPRLWAASGWTPFRARVLVRTLDPATGAFDTVVDNPRPGTAIHFHLGSLSEQPLPETQRLVKLNGRYLTLPEYEPVTPGMTSFGFLGTVPFPMLDALEVRRLSDGQEVLVSSDADPLRPISEPVGTLGFIESFPIRPRLPPPPMSRGLRPLWRWFDYEAQRHRYGSAAVNPDGAVCLGSVRISTGRRDGAARIGEAPCVELRLSDAGAVLGLERAVARARWTAAPLRWGEMSRRRRLRAAADRARYPLPRPGDRSDTPALGYLRATPAFRHSSLYAAVHPVTQDVFLTRAPIEATDMGYRHVRRLGWISDVGADRAAGQDRVWWASRFGTSRRYHELVAETEADPVAPTFAPSDSHHTALLEATSAAGLGHVGAVPGQTTTLVDTGSDSALAVAVVPHEASLLAIVAQSHRRCAERCGADYVVTSIGDEGERAGRLAEVAARYRAVHVLEADVLLGPAANPFVDPSRDVRWADRSLPFGDRRRRLLELVGEQSRGAAEPPENRR